MRITKVSMIVSSSLGLESIWGAFRLGLTSSTRKDLASKPGYGVHKMLFIPGWGSALLQ